MPELVSMPFKYEFSEAEAHNMAVELAEGIKKIKAINAEKKEVAARYKREAEDVKLACDELSVKVSDGFEMRDISCWVEYNKPSAGKKEITRIDTGEIITESMTEEDWTLFNQC